MGKDHTLHALVPGTVEFKKKRLGRTFVNILPDLNYQAPVKAQKAPPVASNEEEQNYFDVDEGAMVVNTPQNVNYSFNKIR